MSLDLVVVAAVEEELGARGLVDERGDEGPHDGEHAGCADDQNPVDQTSVFKSDFRLQMICQIQMYCN